MKLFFYELLKIFKSKFIVCVFVCLLALNALICIRTVSEQNAGLTDNMVEQVYTLYYNNPEYIDTLYNDWMERYQTYEEKYISYIKRGGEEPIPPENMWMSNGQSDHALYQKLYYDANRPLIYMDSIAGVINAAKSTLVSMQSNLNMDNFTYRYQQKIVDIYTDLYGTVNIGFENTKGYDLYFSNQTPLYISLIACVFLSGYWYTVERATAAYNLIRTTLRGRFVMAYTKVAAALLSGIVFCLASHLTWFFIVARSVGFGSIYNAIQAYSDFTFCQYDLTVIEYLFADTVLKILCISVFTSVCLLLASVTDYLASCLLNSTALILCIGHYYMTIKAPDDVPHLTNIIAVACASLKRYHAINFFGTPCDSLLVIVVTYAIILTIFINFSVVLYICNTTPKFRIKIPNFPRCDIHGLIPQFRFKPTLNLLKFERNKLLGNRTVIIMIMAYLLYVVAMYQVSLNSLSTDDEKLRDYIETSLYGVSTNEKYEFVTREGKRLADAVEEYNETVDNYYQGKISIDEFKPIANEKAYADSRKAAYLQLSEYTNYISSIDSTLTPWFVYDGGWNKLFSDSVDPILIILCCYIGAIISGLEYGSNTSSGNFYTILSTTKNGHRRTFYCKLFLTVVVSTLLYATKYMVSIIALNNIYTLNGLFAPICSLPLLSGHIFTSSTVLMYMVMHFVYGCAMISLISISAMSFTMIIKKAFASFGILAAVYCLPMLLEYSDVAIFDGISIYHLLNLTNIKDSIRVIAICLYVILLIFLSIYAYIKFTNLNNKTIRQKAR